MKNLYDNLYFYEKIHKVVITNRKRVLLSLEHKIAQFCTLSNDFTINKECYHLSTRKNIYIIANVDNIMLYDLICFQNQFNIRLIVCNFVNKYDILITDSGFFDNNNFNIKLSEFNNFFLISYKGF